jgi:glycosyltransferase involved in cell wall biosynthesis
MKIAVFHNLPSGGAKRALYGYVDYLNQKNHTVDVFVPSTANEDFLPLKDVSNSVKVFPVKKSLKGSLYSNLKYVSPLVKKISLRDLEITQKTIAQTINSEDYHLVFSEQDQYTITPFFLKYIKHPTVYYCPQPPRNEAILEKVENNREINPLKRFIFNYSDNKDLKIDKENISYAENILTNSYFTRESILRVYGLNSLVSYLGIDTKIFQPLTISEENFVLSVGSCRPSKGYDFIIRSLALIEPQIRPKLVIVSNFSLPEWKTYIENLAQQLGVELEILDLVDDEKLVELYNQAKLILYAPYMEPFGLVPLEAMGCGTPVVGVKEGGVRETIIHNITGIHCQRDEKLFAEATTKLLLNDLERKKMAENSIKTIEDYWTIKHAGERLIWHFNRVLDNL